MIYNSTGRMKQCANGKAPFQHRYTSLLQLSKIPRKPTFIYKSVFEGVFFFLIRMGSTCQQVSISWVPCLGLVPSPVPIPVSTGAPPVARDARPRPRDGTSRPCVASAAARIDERRPHPWDRPGDEWSD